MQPTQYGRNLSKTGAEQARLIGDCGFAYNNTFTFPNCFGVCKPNDCLCQSPNEHRTANSNECLA